VLLLAAFSLFAPRLSADCSHRRCSVVIANYYSAPAKLVWLLALFLLTSLAVAPGDLKIRTALKRPPPNFQARKNLGRARAWSRTLRTEQCRFLLALAWTDAVHFARSANVTLSIPYSTLHAAEPCIQYPPSQQTDDQTQHSYLPTYTRRRPTPAQASLLCRMSLIRAFILPFQQTSPCSLVLSMPPTYQALPQGWLPDVC